MILATIRGFLSLISKILNFIEALLNNHCRTIEIVNKLYDFIELKDEEKLRKLIRENQTRNNFKSFYERF